MINHKSLACSRIQIISATLNHDCEEETYFAPPYAPHERGLNENANSLLRQFVPKGTDLRTVIEEDLQHYQGALNSRPHKCLGFSNPRWYLQS